jgi:hypothetical protein
VKALLDVAEVDLIILLKPDMWYETTKCVPVINSIGLHSMLFLKKSERELYDIERFGTTSVYLSPGRCRLNVQPEATIICDIQVEHGEHL